MEEDTAEPDETAAPDELAEFGEVGEPGGLEEIGHMAGEPAGVVRMRVRFRAWATVILTSRKNATIPWFRRGAEAARADVEPPAREWAEVQAMAAVYEDVRSFGRHLDEKLRSLITALAFLMAAGISIFVFASRGGSNDLLFDGRTWNVANVFFVVFVVTISLSLASALVAMDPTGHRPHFLRGAPPPRSILYYEAILHDPWWSRPTEDVTLEELHGRLFKSYREDAFALARRARHKAARAQNAEALLAVALVCLVVVSITRLPQSSASTRTLLLTIVLVIFSVSPFVTYWRMRAADFPALSGREVQAEIANTLRLVLFFGLPLFVLGLLIFESFHMGRAHWPYLAYAMLWIGAGRLASFTQRGHWAALVIAAVGLIPALVMIGDAQAFKRPLPLTIRLSHSVISDTARGVLCVRITGRARTQAEIRISGGESVPVTPLNVALSAQGTASESFAVLRGFEYGVDVREVSDPDFVHASYYFPEASQPVQPPTFHCPALTPGQRVTPTG